MKARNWFLVFFLIITFAIVLPLNANASRHKPAEFSVSNLFPPQHLHAKTLEAWGNAVEKRTGGKVKFNYYHGGTLLKGPKIYDGVLKGITDIGMSVLGYSRGVFPVLEAVDLPLGYQSGMQATMVINDYINIVKPKEVSKVKVLFMHAHGPGLLHSKKPVYKMEDLKGLKIRSYGFNARVAKMLGGVPVAMPQPSVYEALQKGVVDASLSPYEVLYGFKQADVIRATTECYGVGYTAGFFVFMNLNKWNALPPDVQKVMDQVSAEWIPIEGETWDKLDKLGKDFTIKKGNKIIPLSDAENARWKKAVQPVIQMYIDDKKKMGMPAEKYVDTLKGLVQKYAQ